MSDSAFVWTGVLLGSASALFALWIHRRMQRE